MILRQFGINKNIKRTLNIILNKEPVKMDVNVVNDRYFIHNSSRNFTKLVMIFQEEN